MRCPSCGGAVREPGAVSCPQCGHALDPDQSAVTQQLEPDSPTREVKPVYRARRVRSVSGEIVRWLAPEDLRERLPAACSAAVVGFLALLCVGAVLLLAARLHYPLLGRAADPLRVLTAIVITSLAVLRVPVHLGDLEVTVLPLGALVVAGFAFAWAVNGALREKGSNVSAKDGALAAVPFALLVWLSALIFRLRDPAGSVGAEAGLALIAGLCWGGLFGALGAASVRRSPREWAAGKLQSLSPLWREGITTGFVMLGAAALLATGASLLWAIGVLMRGLPYPGFGLDDAVAATVYLAAFVPNIVVIVISLGLGAPLEVGARLAVGRRPLDAEKRYSLADWGGGATPWFVFLLILIPLLAGACGGWWTHRLKSEKPVAVLSVAAGVFSIALATLGLLGRARLGAGIAGTKGFVLVSPQLLAVLILGFAVTFAASVLTWILIARLGSEQ